MKGDAGVIEYLNKGLRSELTAVSQAGAQSDVTRVLDAVSVPAGSYGQMRLFPLAQDASLSDAASAAGRVRFMAALPG